MSTDQDSVGGAGKGSALPQPAEWASARYPLWSVTSVGFLAVMALGGAAAGVWALTSGRLAAGLLLVAGALYVGHVVGLGVSAWWTPRGTRRPARLSAASEGGTGVTFTYSPWPYYWLSGLLLLTALGLAAIAAIAAATGTVGIVMAAIAALLAAAVAWFLVTVLRLAPGKITLSPTGVHHHSLTFTHFVPWYAVFAVAADWVGTPLIVAKAFPSDDTRVRRYTGRFGTQEMQLLPYMAVRARWLAADPATVYHVLVFYHANPDLRAELGTTAALTRINNGAISA
jgi:hypothetical protein